MPASGQYSIDKAPFRIGVRYWPQRGGPDFFRHFDVDEVHEDFAVLSEVGINLARVALDWQYFQPDPDTLRCSALAHLLQLCDAAASEGVRLELLLFASPLGVEKALPSWLGEFETHSEQPEADPNGRLIDPFSNPSAQRAVTNLVRGIARTVGGHQAIWAYNLGDRPDRRAPRCCHVASKTWFDQLPYALHAVDGRHPVTCSLNGTSLLTNDSLRVDQVFSVLDHSTIDCHGLARDIDQPDSELVAAFSCALTTALSGKPCLLEETNAVVGTAPSPGSDNPLDSLLDALHRVGALGTLIGSFVDSPMPSDGSGVGRRSGLFGASGEPRQHARAIRAFARSSPMVLRPAPQTLKLDVSADEYYAHPSVHAMRLYREFSVR